MTFTAEQTLENATRLLRKWIAESPPASWTAEMARRTLAIVESPDCKLSTSQKAEVVVRTINSFKASRKLDNILHHPGDRKHGIIE